MANSMLVSVCVVTYNSSKFILETLDSIYNQTYDNIQLIVSDDGSKDETVIIVRKWLLEKGSRFVDPQLLTVKSNTGTTANCNRAFRAAKGEWIKDIAGDDVLFPNSIKEYVSFVLSKPEVKWVWAKAVCYLETISDNSIIKKGEDFSKTKSILLMDNIGQLRRIVLSNYVWYPSHFIKKDLYNSVDGFDEDYGIYEDFPMWLKFLSSGEKCYFLDEYLFGYRRSEQSVVNNTQFIVNRNIRKLKFRAEKQYAFQNLTWVEKMFCYLDYGQSMFFSIPILNKRTKNRLRLYSISRNLLLSLFIKLQNGCK